MLVERIFHPAIETFKKRSRDRLKWVTLVSRVSRTRKYNERLRTQIKDKSTKYR